MVEIIRPATESEKSNFIEISATGAKSLLDDFLIKLTDFRQKYLKEYKPYDAYSARIDFENQIREMINDVNSSVGIAANVKESVKAIRKFDFEQYGDSDRFDYLGVSEISSAPVKIGVGGIRVDEKTEKSFEFRGKKRGNGMSICVPNKDFEKVEEYVNKTYKKVSK